MEDLDIHSRSSSVRKDSVEIGKRLLSANVNNAASPNRKNLIKEALKDETEFDVVTDEEKRLMMLGHIVKTKAAEPLYMREDFCGVCGIQHSNPDVLDMYPYCAICAHTLREPCVLRKRYVGVVAKQPLEILYATYGDPFDCTKIIDVTAICDELTHEYKTRDRLYIRSSVNLCHLFNNGVDFMPGKQKQLRIRYRMKGTVFGYVNADTTVSSRFPTGFFLTVPSIRYLTIVSCTYGHPKGRAATGRMSYDITEKVQGLVDLNGGSYLVLSAQTPIARYFGDPCPGYVKDLYIMYDIDGRVGSVTQAEINGRLVRKVFIQESPIVAPLMFVVSAAYGVTPSGRRERLLSLSSTVKKILAVEHRLKQGLAMQVEDVVLMKNKDKVLAERKYFKDTETKFVDITPKMQKIVDMGRNALVLDQSFDPNLMFGNPIPLPPPEPEPEPESVNLALTELSIDIPGSSQADGEADRHSKHSEHRHHHSHHHNSHSHHRSRHHSPKCKGEHTHKKKKRVVHTGANKLLEIQLECQGHDSEKTADSREVTLSGYPRNFITGKTARFAIPVRDDILTGRGVLEETLDFRTNNSHPIIIITKALYGYMSDLSKVVDVTNEVQGLVKGRFLEIGRELNLDKIFTNPCRGLQKHLKINYMTRGFSGSIRIREKDDLLVATVELGYPPIKPVDDEELESKYA